MIVGVALDLQVDQLGLVTGAARRIGDHLQAERFEPQEHPRVQQGTGVYEQQPHRGLIPKDVEAPPPVVK
jgi:hypothetical protein